MKTINGKVELNVGTGDDKKTFSAPVTYHEFENAHDLLEYMKVPEHVGEVISAVNYGFNLAARSQVRQQLMKESAGPEKAIDKAIKAIVSARAIVGKPISEADARKMVLAMGLAEETPETTNAA